MKNKNHFTVENTFKLNKEKDYLNEDLISGTGYVKT